MRRERQEPGGETRGGPSNTSRRGRGVRRGGSTPASDAGFDRFGKREFERHSGSDKTYNCLLVSSRSFSFGASCSWDFSFTITALHCLCVLVPSQCFNCCSCRMQLLSSATFIYFLTFEKNRSYSLLFWKSSNLNIPFYSFHSTSMFIHNLLGWYFLKSFPGGNLRWCLK